MDGLSENMNVVMNGWIVREYTDVLTGADGLSASTNVVLSSLGGLIVRGQKCCQEWMDCKRALSEKYKLSQNKIVRDGWTV